MMIEAVQMKPQQQSQNQANRKTIPEGFAQLLEQMKIEEQTVFTETNLQPFENTNEQVNTELEGNAAILNDEHRELPFVNIQPNEIAFNHHEPQKEQVTLLPKANEHSIPTRFLEETEQLKVQEQKVIEKHVTINTAQNFMKNEQQAETLIKQITNSFDGDKQAVKPSAEPAAQLLQPLLGKTVPDQIQKEPTPHFGFTVNMTEVVNEAEQTVKAKPPAMRMTHMIEDLKTVFRGHISQVQSKEMSQIRVNIFPEHLGHVDILVTQQEGKVSAKMLTSSFATKEALELQMGQLRVTLQQQGITMDKIEVTQQQTETNGFSFNQSSGEKSQKEFEQQAKSNQSGNSAAVDQEEIKDISQPADNGIVGENEVNYTA